MTLASHADELVATLTRATAATDQWRRAYGTPHTGAMVALVPTPADADRLALGGDVEGAEPADELHLTLWYLGEAAAIPAATQAAIIQAIRSMVTRRRLPPVEARAFGAALWNPDAENPAWVLNVGDPPDGARPDGQERLAVAREMMSEAWHDGMVPYVPPAQHTPWSAHVCLAYSDDPELAAEVANRTGPVTFDRIRVAFGGRHTDIPLVTGGRRGAWTGNAPATMRAAGGPHWKLQPRDLGGEGGGQWVDSIPGAEAVATVKAALSKKLDKVHVAADRRGVHITADTKYGPATVTITPFDFATLALGLASGGVGTAVKAAQIAGKLRQAAKLAKIAKAAKAAEVGVEVAGAVVEAKNKKKRDDPGRVAIPAHTRVPGGPQWEHQGRDDEGQWTGMVGGGALRDALKLAGRVDLDPGEEYVGSDKMVGDSGAVRIVATRVNGQPSVRIGVGNEQFGGRDDEAGPWRGGRVDASEVNAERDRLRSEQSAIEDTDEDAWTPEQKRRYAELDDMDLNEVYANGYAARLDAASARRLHSELSAALAKAQAVRDEVMAPWDEIERMEASLDALSEKREPLVGKYVAFAGQSVPEEYGGGYVSGYEPVPGAPEPTPDEMAELDRLTDEWMVARDRIEEMKAAAEAADANADWSADYERSRTQGVVSGEWADIHYDVFGDDFGGVGVEMHLTAVPHGMTMELLDDEEVKARFDAVEAAKLLHMLGRTVAEPTARGYHRKAGGDHWQGQPRNPRTGEWIDMSFGPVSMGRLTEIFGGLAREVAVGDYRIQAREDGRVVVAYEADGPDEWHVAHHYSPDDARKLGDHLDDMISEAADYDDDDLDQRPEGSERFSDTVSESSRLPDGTYVGHDRVGDIQVTFGGDEDDRHDLGEDEANELAYALRDMADWAEDSSAARQAQEEYERAEARRLEEVARFQQELREEMERADRESAEEREREEAERLREEREEAEREALEKAANWWQDEPTAVVQWNSVSMWDPDEVEIKNDSPRVSEWAVVQADDLAPLAAALRGFRERAAELAASWEGEDEDGDEIEPDVVDFVESGGITLMLLEDGNMTLQSMKRPEGKDPIVWDTMVWQDEADQLADHLDRLLAKIKAAPKLSATRAHQRFDPNQPRVPGGVGEQGGEWTDTLGIVKGIGGDVGMSLARLVKEYGLPVQDVVIGDDEGFITRFSRGDVVLSHDLSSRVGEPRPGRRVADLITDDEDGLRRIADRLDRDADNGDEVDEDTEAGSGGLVDWDVEDGLLIGYDENGDVSVRWAKPDADLDDDDAIADVVMEDGIDADGLDGWDMGPSGARDFAEALREIADFEPEEIDTVDAGADHGLMLWSDFDISFTEGGAENVTLTMRHDIAGRMRAVLDEMRSQGAGQAGAPELRDRAAYYTIRSRSDGSVTIGVGDKVDVTIPPGASLNRAITGLDDLLEQVNDLGRFEYEDEYAADPSALTLLETVGARARRIFRELIRKYGGPGGTHWMDQFRDDDGRFAESGLSAALKKVAKVKGFMYGRRPVKVRPRYAELKTTEDVQRRLQLDLRKVLRQPGGKNAVVRFGDTDVNSAREFAEGIMRVAERWPETRLDAVRVGDLEGKSFGQIAVAPRSQRVTITLDEGLSRDRKRGLQRLRRGMQSGRPGDDYTYVAASLFGAAVDGMVAGDRPERDHATRAVAEHLKEANVDVNDRSAVQSAIAAQLGDVALHSRAAAVSEALADDALHGDGASPLSQRIRAEVTRSYNDLLEGGKLVDYKQPEAKVPKGPLMERPRGSMEKPFTGRKLTQLEKAQEMVASGRYSPEVVLELLGLAQKPSGPDITDEEISNLTARLLRDAGKAGKELTPEQASIDARTLLEAAKGARQDPRRAVAFRDALFMTHRVNELAMKGDSLQLLKFLKRQNTSTLYGVAAIYGIRVSDETKLRPTHANLVEAIAKRALADADLYAKAKKGTYEVVRSYDPVEGEDIGEILAQAFYAWLDAGGADALDEDVPAAGARALLAAFAR